MEKEGKAGMPNPIGDSESGSRRGEGMEKGKEGSLDWGVQARLFSTLSTAFTCTEAYETITSLL